MYLLSSVKHLQQTSLQLGLRNSHKAQKKVKKIECSIFAPKCFRMNCAKAKAISLRVLEFKTKELLKPCNSHKDGVTSFQQEFSLANRDFECFHKGINSYVRQSLGLR